MAQNKPKSGRPTKLNEKTVSLLETHLQFGHSVAEACYAAKISRETFYKWYRESPTFSDRMRQARFQLIQLAKQTIYQAVADGDTKAAMWVIEKFAPDSFTAPLDSEIPAEPVDTGNTPVAVEDWDLLEQMVDYRRERKAYAERHKAPV